LATESIITHNFTLLHLDKNMSRPQNLYRLQKIDSQIDQLQARLNEIEDLLSDDAKLRKVDLLAKKAEKKLEAALREQTQAETKVKDQRVKIEQTESTLYSGSIQNPKELQDIQNEVEALKRFLDVLEERQLEAMIACDEAAEKNQEAQGILQKYRALAEQQHAGLKGERTKLQEETSNLSKKRKTAAEAITDDDLALYNRLRKQRAGVAVAKVRDRACGACGSTLTASLHQTARSPSQVTFCDSCSRILYAT
jgi:predicted  nucleic acid-binding Zn-ribbon protein